MKKVLITMAVFTSMVAGAMVFSSFTVTKTNETACLQTIPTYWEGSACMDGSSDPACRISIKVYQVEGQCNSYYAVVQKDKSEVWVRENPDYDPNDRGGRWSGTKVYKYYITYGNHNWYFSM